MNCIVSVDGEPGVLTGVDPEHFYVRLGECKSSEPFDPEDVEFQSEESA